MRSINPSHEFEYIYYADTIATVVLTSGAAQALDWPSGAEFFHISAGSRVFLNVGSTSATIPTTTVQASTDSANHTILHNTAHAHLYRIPGGSTGYSLISESTAMVTIEFWKD